MEPVSTFHDCVEIEIRRISLSNSRVCAVVDNLGWAHRSTCLTVIKTYAITTTCNILRVNTVATQRINSNLTNLVSRELCYEVSIVTIVGTAYGNVSFTTTRDDTENVCLNKTVLTVWRKAEHNLAQSYYFCHCL